jgi:hypothetical protein
MDPQQILFNEYSPKNGVTESEKQLYFVTNYSLSLLLQFFGTLYFKSD